MRALPGGWLRRLSHLALGALALAANFSLAQDSASPALDEGTDRAARLVAGLRARLDQIAARVAGRSRPRVAVIEWTDPPYTAGHWIPDLVVAAGGKPVAARPGGQSVPTTWASIAASEPDVLIVAPCGYHLAGAAEQAQAVAAAMPGLPIWAIDADGIIVRPGPRLIDGAEAIASILHPDAVPAAPPGRVARVAGVQAS